MALREPHIVHPDPKYSRVRLIEPTTLGYLLVAAEVQPRRVPFLPNRRAKNQLLARLREIARELERLDTVEQVTIFDGVAFAPPSEYVRERRGTIRIPRFDVVVLIETQSPADACDVRTAPAYQALVDALASMARGMYVIAARNAKRIADVDKTRKGVFLFNYFVGDDPAVVLDVWDYLAQWYAIETGLDNSTLLVPLAGERSDYVAINNARWDGSLLGVVLRQLTRPSFRTYLLANLQANYVGAMPILYRVADLPPRPANAARRGALAAAAVALGVGVALRRRRRAARQ